MFFSPLSRACDCTSTPLIRAPCPAAAMWPGRGPHEKRHQRINDIRFELSVERIDADQWTGNRQQGRRDRRPREKGQLRACLARGGLALLRGQGHGAELRRGDARKHHQGLDHRADRHHDRLCRQPAVFPPQPLYQHLRLCRSVARVSGWVRNGSCKLLYILSA